jgi:hypothetical protein
MAAEEPARMTSPACDEAQLTAAEVLAANLALSPRQLMLLSAVHEAGHIFAADTAGLTPVAAEVRPPATGSMTAEGDAMLMPLHPVMVMLAAGFSAVGIWLVGRGTDVNDRCVNPALCALSSDDISLCRARCDAAGRPDLSMQDGVRAATDILICRWPAVLRTAYALARHRTLYAFEIRAFLAADPAQRGAAVTTYCDRQAAAGADGQR